MSVLPDEIWRKILESAIETSKLNYRDLCCVSITCRRLNRLSNDDFLWSTLIGLDFRSENSTSIDNLSSSKVLYRTRFERFKAMKLLAHRRAVLNIESRIFSHKKCLEENKTRLCAEKEKLKVALKELAELEKIRSASVALNVWQPEIIRDRQRQMIGQCTVPIEFRVRALEMEIKLCKNQIFIIGKNRKGLEKNLEESKEKLKLLNYHPLRDFPQERSMESCLKRKKLKICRGVKEITLFMKYGLCLRARGDVSYGRRVFENIAYDSLNTFTQIIDAACHSGYKGFKINPSESGSESSTQEKKIEEIDRCDHSGCSV